MNMFAYCGNNPVMYIDPNGYYYIPIWDEAMDRIVEMYNNPNWYTIGNWLTLGTFDSIKGTFHPSDPLSLQHWLDSATTALLVTTVAGKVIGIIPKGLGRIEVKILGKGSTGRTIANNLKEQLAMQEDSRNADQVPDPCPDIRLAGLGL